MVTPEQMLTQAKMALMTKASSFLIHAALSLQHKFTDDPSYTKTACVDGKVITYNTAFFVSCDPDIRVSIILHETWHVILGHIARRGNRDPAVYNYAGDYVINQFILSDGFKIDSQWLYDIKYKELSTDEVYDLLIQNPDDIPDGVEPDVKYAATQEEITEAEAATRDIILQGAALAAAEEDKGGELPGEVQRVIDELINPRLSWEEELARFVTVAADNDYSWEYPNKQYFPEFYLPSLTTETQLKSLTIAIDTSGSITDTQLQQILSEIENIRALYTINKLVILDCDYVINNVHKVEQYTEILELPFTGGGGSRCSPVFEWCKENNAELLIYFTDLRMPAQKEGVDFDVLWVVYDNPNATVVVGDIVFLE